MKYSDIRMQVSRCWYETSMADAFRRALGLPTEAAERPKRDFDGERRERFYSKMMRGRIGALDRGYEPSQR